jgi:hypothetical protein
MIEWYFIVIEWESNSNRILMGFYSDW